MNKILIILILALPYISICQCEIDAGADQILCNEEIYDSPTLNGQIISGNVVQLAWESEYYEPTLDKTYYASSMLDDTTITTPVIESHNERSVKFFLKGITANGEECIDSTIVHFSDWTFLTIDKVTGKLPTDTVSLWIAAHSNWPHVQYEWSPNYMISDTTIEKPKVWNDITTFYNLVITDSIGCSVTDDVFEVYSISNFTKEKSEHNIKVYPNPVSNILQIEGDTEIEKVQILTMDGQLIFKGRSPQIDFSNYESGNYVIRISLIDGSTVTEIVQKIEQ